MSICSREWLKEVGFSILISDTLGDELLEVKQATEDAAYVETKEIVTVTENWDLYQGQKITTEDVRSWLQQVETNVDQRALFLLLKNLRFYGEVEVREFFGAAHSRVRQNQKLPPFIRRSRAQRRDDIVVSYAGGLGKSGAHYATLYANTAEIISRNVIEPSKICKFMSSLSSIVNRLASSSLMTLSGPARISWISFPNYPNRLQKQRSVRLCPLPSLSYVPLSRVRTV